MLAAIARNHVLEVTDIDQPLPAASEALVRVAASSINQGEVRGIRSAPHWQMSGHAEYWVPGWDFAGTGERPDAEGRGAPAGSRVVGWVRQGAWAEQVTVPIDQMVVIPESVDFRQASTVPIAGLTAWHALRLAELAPGKRVLVMGANGGVGRFALQIARATGASTVGVVTSESRRASVAEIADGVSVGLPEEGAFDIILDGVGGSVLAKALFRVAPFGTVVSYGNSSGEQTCFEASPLFRKPCLRLQSFALHDELARRSSMGEGLSELVDLMAREQVRSEIALEAPLTDVAQACDALMARKVDGKAVLVVE